jgi:tetratricopeptide (TPR) repeat protein
VSTPPYKTARIDELERPDGWSPIRLALDVQSFGVNAWTAHEGGEQLISEHEEEPSGHEELYVGIAGHASFTVAGEEIDAPTGTIVFVGDPLTMRGAVARDAGTTVLAIGGKPGEAYEPRSWEATHGVLGLFERGEHEEAKRLLLEALESYPDEGTIYYNLACAEAQLGDTDAALERLRTALAKSPSLAGLARDDSDFEPIRDDPHFAEIVAAS